MRVRSWLYKTQIAAQLDAFANFLVKPLFEVVHTITPTEDGLHNYVTSVSKSAPGFASSDADGLPLRTGASHFPRVTKVPLLTALGLEFAPH